MSKPISEYTIADLMKNAYMEGREDSEFDLDNCWEMSDTLGLIEGRRIDLRWKEINT